MIIVRNSSVFSWLYIGEAYINYRSELEQIGFTDKDGPAKLPYLERALAAHKDQEVFQNLKTMSLRDFISYARTEPDTAVSDKYRNRWVITERGNTYYLNSKLAIIISSRINRRAAEYLKKIIRIAGEALEQEGVVLPISLRSMREARRFEPAAERLKKQLRTG